MISYFNGFSGWFGVCIEAPFNLYANLLNESFDEKRSETADCKSFNFCWKYKKTVNVFSQLIKWVKYNNNGNSNNDNNKNKNKNNNNFKKTLIRNASNEL